jgi:phosphatidylinositol alpha-1,6-mannosyltransferase
MMEGIREVLVLAPRVDGADGVSEVSRQFIAALDRLDPGLALAVLTLDGGVPAGRSLGRAQFRSANGSRTRLSAWALARARSSADDLLVVVLHVHLAPLALPLEMRGARLAFFFHGVEVWQRLRARERRALDRAAVLMANSHWTVDRFKQANPEYASADVCVCHLGVPPAATAAAPAIAGYALIVGRLAPDERYKGHDALIDVWPAVCRLVPNATLLIVGDGADRARLETRVAARGLSHAVRFAGRVSAGALEGFYRAAAFFAMPSVGEGFGLAFLEAMRAGKACLAAPGAAAEVIRDGETGFIVDPANTDLLAATLVRLFREPELRATMGTAGRARVEATFEPQHFARRVLEALSDALVHA